MTSTTDGTDHLSARWRIAPSIPVAIGVTMAYSIVFVGIAASSAIPYGEWFATAPNAWRAAVLPLLGGAVVLVTFLAWARRDGVFRDPGRLAMTAVLWAATAIFAGCFLIRLLFVGWNRLTPGLLVACAAAGVLVGFCEEVLFRGIVLRALRNGTRPEAWAVLASAVCFGLFHLTNIINGSPLEAVLPQVAIAAVSGAVLYLFRRGTGMLLAGMVAHGLWDFSLFVPGAGTTTAAVISVSFTVLVVIVGVVVLIAIIVRDRGTVMTPAGVRTGPAAAVP
jgi:membrane protease YdiL (CAAX protease family)